MSQPPPDLQPLLGCGGTGEWRKGCSSARWGDMPQVVQLSLGRKGPLPLGKQAEQLGLAKAKIIVPGCDVAVENIRHKLNASAVQNRLSSVSLVYLL